MRASTEEHDQLRTMVHGMWAGVADRWADYADYADERAARLTDRMLDVLSLSAGDRVLELACGPGGAGLAAAERIGADGVVVLSDVVREMVAIAASRAQARQLGNVVTRTLDLEAVDEADGSFDAVLCREGLMFAVDPGRAATELYRVLRSGGRVAIAVWGPRDKNPWLGLVFDAVTDVTGMPVPPPGMPGPFALSDPARLRSLLADAEFDDIVLETVPVPLRSPSFEAWWTRTTALAGPIAALLAGLGPDTKEKLQQRLRDSVASFTTAAGLELPGLSILATGRRQ